MAWHPEESPFTAFKAANPNGGDLYMRTACTEYKILSEIERQIKDTPNISGKIKLFTELKCCDSCSDVIAQFLERHPNIDIEIIHNNDKRIKKWEINMIIEDNNYFEKKQIQLIQLIDILKNTL